MPTSCGRHTWKNPREAKSRGKTPSICTDAETVGAILAWARLGGLMNE